MFKQYFYIILLVYANILMIASKEIPKPYVNDNINKQTSSSLNSTASKEIPKPYVNDNINTQISSSLNSTSSIPSEGGGKISIEPVTKHQNREHAHSSSSSTPATSIEKISVKKTTTISSPSVKIANAPIAATENHTSFREIIKPVSEAEEIIGDSKVKPRKGVTFEPVPTPILAVTVNSTKADITKTINATITTTKKPSTSTTFIPRKPTVTIGSDDEVLARIPPKLFINSKEVLPKNFTNPPPKLITGEDPIFISRRVKKSPDYVLPIVLTILSVPLLAIILTVVYKRGAEWWHHRHYRRMDFLIDGMYNN